MSAYEPLQLPPNFVWCQTTPRSWELCYGPYPVASIERAGRQRWVVRVGLLWHEGLQQYCDALGGRQARFWAERWALSKAQRIERSRYIGGWIFERQQITSAAGAT